MGTCFCWHNSLAVDEILLPGAWDHPLCHIILQGMDHPLRHIIRYDARALRHITRYDARYDARDEHLSRHIILQGMPLFVVCLQAPAPSLHVDWYRWAWTSGIAADMAVTN